MENIPIPVKGDFSARRLEQKFIYDVRTFLPHQIKEDDVWSWKKMKNEKCFTFFDCNTHKIIMWKQKETKRSKSTK